MKRVIPQKPIGVKIVTSGTTVRIDCGHAAREGGRR